MIRWQQLGQRLARLVRLGLGLVHGEVDDLPLVVPGHHRVVAEAHQRGVALGQQFLDPVGDVGHP